MKIYFFIFGSSVSSLFNLRAKLFKNYYLPPPILLNYIKYSDFVN